MIGRGGCGPWFGMVVVNCCVMGWLSLVLYRCGSGVNVEVGYEVVKDAAEADWWWCGGGDDDLLESSSFIEMWRW
jgi:hypothetical protein